MPPNLPNTFDVDTEVKANTFIGPTPCPATYALTAFYKATKVTNWAPTPSTTTRWMIGDPCTNSNGVWYGITCSTGGTSTEVLKLELQGDGSTDLATGYTGCGSATCGTLPTELGGLTSLTSDFSLFGNGLVGPIPSELGRLMAITSGFLIGTNKLTGTLPTQLGNVGNGNLVDSFSVDSNSLSGTIPSHLGDLTKLTASFKLNDNKLNGELPKQLGKLSEMKSHFMINKNSLQGGLPEIGRASCRERV